MQVPDRWRFYGLVLVAALVRQEQALWVTAVNWGSLIQRSDTLDAGNSEQVKPCATMRSMA